MPMIYKFRDNYGTFVVKDPQRYNLYLPLANKYGTLLSSISPNLAGDIKRDNEHFLTPPASIEDIRNNLICRRDFFIKTENEILRLSHPYNDMLEAGFLYQKVTKKASPLEIEILNFIPHDLAVEVMRVKIKNTGKKDTVICPTSCIPLYGRPEKNLRDHRHVTSLLNRISMDKFGIYLKPTMVFDEKGHRINETCYFVLGFEGKTNAMQGQFPTLDYFLGGGDLIHPEAIERNVKPTVKNSPEFNGKEAIAAFRFRSRRLKPGQETSYFLIMGAEENKNRINKIFGGLNSPKKIDKAFAATKEYWRSYLSYPDFDFKDIDYNNWLLWVKLQPTLRKLFGCSFLPHFDYGKGGRGWRDLWQDALNLIIMEPKKARDLILNNFKGVRIDGSNATIITADNKFISDRNRISRVWMDHGVWPYLTLKSYIQKTGDLNIFLEDITYFKDAQLKRAKGIEASFSQGDFLLRAKNKEIYKGSVLEHVLIENLVQFFNVGVHNITRLENADWNDGLDMAPDKGESVTFSFMYAHNLKDICLFLNELKLRRKKITLFEELHLLLDRLNLPVEYSDYRQKQKRLQAYFEKTENISGRKIEFKIEDVIYDLEEKTRHLSSWLRNKEWLKEGFFNGYYDNNARRVEGKVGNRIRMMLPSQVFAIMSGVATEKQITETWSSIKRHLRDSRLNGFRLNTDFNSLFIELGRAFGFAFGDKENGAFFNHMVVMLANALYKRDFVSQGFEAMNSIYRMSCAPAAKIYPVLPEYFNGEGRGLYLYLTGSASWYIHTLLEETLGINFVLGDILLNPKLTPSNFPGDTCDIGLKLRLNNKLVRIIYIRTAKGNHPYRVEHAQLNRRRIAKVPCGFLIKIQDLKERHNLIKVFLS